MPCRTFKMGIAETASLTGLCANGIGFNEAVKNDSSSSASTPSVSR